MDRREFLGSAAIGLISGFLPWNGAQAKNSGLLGYLRTNWSRDPYTYGAYSYYPKGVNIIEERAHLEAPVAGKIFFAGEAFFPTHSSTVHSAYESGQRTARHVLKTGAKRIAVIGAGMSGLSAAQWLSSKGAEVTVYEARDQIGGRIRTDESLGVPLDLGASWIHGARGNPITRLANKSNQKRVSTDVSYVTRGKGGRLIPDSQFPNWLEQVSEIQHEAGANLDQLNLDAYQNEGGYAGQELIFPNGYIGVFDALKGAYSLRLSSVVKKIRLNEDSLSVFVKNNNSEEFDAVIVTVSLGVLKKELIRFEPVLPVAKTNAIKKWGMGTLDKVYLQFDKPFWDKDKTWILTPENDLPRGQFNQWLNMYKYLDKPVLLAFNGAGPALELATMSDDEIVRRALQTLRLAYPA